MKTFDDLYIGDYVYECNFKKCKFTKYEVLEKNDSDYTGQLSISLHDVSRENKTRYYDEYVTTVIDVFKNKSYEHRRQMIGHDDDVYWCADKNAVIELFEQYQSTLNGQLKHQRELINRL